MTHEIRTVALDQARKLVTQIKGPIGYQEHLDLEVLRVAKAFEAYLTGRDLPAKGPESRTIKVGDSVRDMARDGKLVAFVGTVKVGDSDWLKLDDGLNAYIRRMDEVAPLWMDAL